MSTTDILQAAFQKLESFIHSPQPPIIYPGVKPADPPETGIWLQPGFFPNEPDDIAWDNDACLDTRGFFQILIYFRPGQGLIEPSELADALIAFFPKGSDLGPVRIRKRPWQSPAVTEDASKLFIPVTVPYKGLT
jgi:hypothetical protein